jgi:Ni,Fe-hydrogenase III small subunit
MWSLLRQILRVGIRRETAPAAEHEPAPDQDPLTRALTRALSVRVVDAGSCNGCELEIHALANPLYNAEGAGIRFVASPRHADVLLVTGPVTRNMRQALVDTWLAMPEPRRVVALGECACTGGVFGEDGASLGRVSAVIPVDLAVPGCPPRPQTIIAALHQAARTPATTSPPPASGPGRARRDEPTG